MAIFAFLHCSHSAAYTAVTLESFFRYTPLSAADQVLVLDNDGDFKSNDARLEVLRTNGQTFAQNVNVVLWRALQEHTAAYCCNNDLLFTRGWREPLEQMGNCLATPVHHHNVPSVTAAKVVVPRSFDIEFYRQHEAALREFCDRTPELLTRRRVERVWFPSFSCVRIPAEIIGRLGPLDERFRNGGEDGDYVLRAHLQGIECVVPQNSFVFHFGGKSTYNIDPGHTKKTASKTWVAAPLDERDEFVSREFTAKWGRTVTELFAFKTYIPPQSPEPVSLWIRKAMKADGTADQAPQCQNAEFPIPDPHAPRTRYIDLLSRCLPNVIYGDAGWLDHEKQAEYDPEIRRVGRDWPHVAHTMIGTRRLQNLRFCVEDVLRRQVPGDFIETGVWRGGATILMRGILEAYGITDRRVWVADSFAGLPPPDPSVPQDTIPFHEWKQLAVSLDNVKANYHAYDLLDSQVTFLKGWFRDTLPVAPIERLAVVRLDGDMYESTMDGLQNLYHKLSPGGFLIVDDYHNIQACNQAVTDFRQTNGIVDEIQTVDWGGVYWRKS